MISLGFNLDAANVHSGFARSRNDNSRSFSLGQHHQNAPTITLARDDSATGQSQKLRDAAAVMNGVDTSSDVAGRIGDYKQQLKKDGGLTKDLIRTINADADVGLKEVIGTGVF